MNTIRLADHSDFLATRFLGEIVRREITDMAALHSVVELDFLGVTGVSHSFADECFGILIAENGLDFFKKNLKFRSLNEEIKAILRFVLAERMQAGPLRVAC